MIILIYKVNNMDFVRRKLNKKHKKKQIFFHTFNHKIIAYMEVFHVILITQVFQIKIIMMKNNSVDSLSY